MFEGFEKRRVGGTHLATAGDGPPVLLIHGYPQTHAMWHRVAPGLVAAGHTVVCPDLRGYGDSDKPLADNDHANYAKRAMAAELVDAMSKLGHDRFGVAGHDRGGRVAYRLTLDHPDRVERLATLDIVPTIEQWESIKGTTGVGTFHWHLLAQPAPLPETLIEPNAEYWLRTLCGKWAANAEALEEGMPHYVAAFTKDGIRGSCDDYRAGARIDVAHDAQDRDAGRKISCPMLVLWGDPSGRRPPLTDVWSRWANDIRGEALPCGHFLPEEAPDRTLTALREFFAPGAS
jgi:haloacetate dehalogenase